MLVDTAGLRRKRRQRQGIEYYSELRALQAAERADVALVLVDASEGLVDQDLTVADVARKAHDSTLVVALQVGYHHRSGSRTSATEAPGRLTPAPSARRRLGQDRPRHRSSARPNRGAVRQAHVARRDGRAEPLPRRAARGAAAAVAERQAAQPPLRDADPASRPPRFRFFVNDPGLITRDYGYWVENQLRDRFELEGVPVSIDFVRRS